MASIAISIYMLTCVHYITNNDFLSFHGAYTTLRIGSIDFIRTPLYPIFVGVSRALFHPLTYTFVITLVQYILFWISIYFMYRLCIGLIKNRAIAIASTAIYACLPGIVNAPMIILTEIPGIPLFVFLAFLLWRIWEEGASAKRCIWLFVIVGTLIFLRPAFLFLVVALAIYIFAYAKHKRQHTVRLAVFTSIPFLTMLVYCACFYHGYGVFAPSCVSTLNDYYVLRQYNLLDPECTDNIDLRNDLEFMFTLEIDDWYTPNEGRVVNNYYNEFERLYVRYGLPEIHQLTANAKNKHFKEFYIDLTAKRFIDSMNYPMFFSFVGFPVLRGKYEPRMWVWYLIYITFAVYLSIIIIRRHRVPWVLLTFWLIVMGNIAIVILGAQNDWSRLSMSVYAINILLTGVLADAALRKCKRLKHKP